MYRAILEHRDMRHFLSKAPAHDLMRRLIDVAMHVWSVASLQPLRVLRITSAGLYVELFAQLNTSVLFTADAFGKRREWFMTFHGTRSLRESQKFS
jgi:nitroreductase